MGEWTEGSQCVCEEKQSCCVEQTCYDGWDREQCVSNGGVHHDVGCEFGRCFVNDVQSIFRCFFLIVQVGGCCDFDRTCYDLPEILCIHSWFPEPCSETFCGAALQVSDEIPPNTTSPGAYTFFLLIIRSVL